MCQAQCFVFPNFNIEFPCFRCNLPRLSLPECVFQLAAEPAFWKRVQVQGDCFKDSACFFFEAHRKHFEKGSRSPDFERDEEKMISFVVSTSGEYFVEDSSGLSRVKELRWSLARPLTQSCCRGVVSVRNSKRFKNTSIHTKP